jgi:hypothetical protein
MKGGSTHMARGQNLTTEARAKGGRNSHKSENSKGNTSNRGLASASKETRERVARAGGRA